MSRVDLGLLLNAGLVLVVGYAALYAAGFARSGVEAVWLVGFAYLVGWGLLGVLLTLGLMLGLSAQGFVVAIFAAACAVAAVAVGRRVPAIGLRPRPLERNPFALAGAGLGAALLAVACAAALLLAVKGTGLRRRTSTTSLLDPEGRVDLLRARPRRRAAAHAAPSRVPAAAAGDERGDLHLVGGFHPSVLPFQMALLGIAFVLRPWRCSTASRRAGSRCRRSRCS